MCIRDSFGGVYFEAAVTMNIQNSIIFGNEPTNIGISDNSTTPVTANIFYSDIEGGEDGIVYNGNPIINFDYNIDANPLFCNPGSGDFSLGENSPCVGTGENGANMGAFGVECGIVNQVLNVPVDYATIQGAIDASIDGDTVLIHPGIYEGAYLYLSLIHI